MRIYVNVELELEIEVMVRDPRRFNLNGDVFIRTPSVTFISLTAMTIKGITAHDHINLLAIKVSLNFTLP